MPIRLRGDFDVQMLRAAARQSKDGPQARRLLALAAIYDGATRTEAAKIGGVTLQVIRDWVLKALRTVRARGCSMNRSQAGTPKAISPLFSPLRFHRSPMRTGLAA